MYPHLIKVQITIMLLVTTANVLLALSIGDSSLAWFSVFAIIVGFIVVDRLKIVNLKGWVANLVLIGVLYMTMRDFIGGSSSGKLLSVANLLAYLQLTLYFQSKTPRLCWQLIVLSILQIVLAAIFNLNFEHFVFFLLYFVFVTTTLFFQHEYQAWNRTLRNNRASVKTARENAADMQTQPAILSPMLVLSKPSHTRYVANTVWMAIPWLLVCTIFSLILFHSLPHSRQSWKSPTLRDFEVTGQSIATDLDVEGFVESSNQLKFRAKFSDAATGKQVIINGEPYFRGMALSKWSVEDDTTRWSAPHDHVFDWSYSKLPSLYRDQFGEKVRAMELEVILEPTRDPLLYAVTPTFKQQRGESDVEFCRAISALTRRRSEITNNIASYIYHVEVLLDKQNRPLKGWPYKPFRYGRDFPSLETGSPEYQLYTTLDPGRYPNLVATAQSTARQTQSSNPVVIANAMVSHFSKANGFVYTTDYRNVQRDETLDSIEDFFSNHHSGHCAMYATALTLMLRSQGIPARYVVGFRGGNYNKLTDSYVIHGRDAHAWVEAYIPPEFCTQDTFDKRMAYPETGMWLTLDPTPANESVVASEALDLARSIWQDYVISPDANKQNYNDNNSLLRKSTRDTMVGNYFDASVEFAKNDRRTQVFGLAGFLLLFMLGSLRNRKFIRRQIRRSAAEVKNRSWFSTAVQAIGFVAPPLARWIQSRGASTTVPFYARLEKILSRYLNLNREPEMTQKEFADVALVAIEKQSVEPQDIKTVENILGSVTAAFYQARFSPIPLDESTINNVEKQIENLKQIIKQSNSGRK